MKSVWRYLMHLLALIVFAFLSLRLYFDFQSFLIQDFSKIKYNEVLESTSDAFSYIILFVVFTYRTDYLIIKKVNIKEYYILPLLLSDIVCLLLTNVIMIMYNNNVYKLLGLASLKSLNNIILAAVLIILKDWVVQSILMKVRPQPGEYAAQVKA